MKTNPHHKSNTNPDLNPISVNSINIIITQLIYHQFIIKCQLEKMLKKAWIFILLKFPILSKDIGKHGKELPIFKRNKPPAITRRRVRGRLKLGA